MIKNLEIFRIEKQFISGYRPVGFERGCLRKRAKKPLRILSAGNVSSEGIGASPTPRLKGVKLLLT